MRQVRIPAKQEAIQQLPAAGNSACRRTRTRARNRMTTTYSSKALMRGDPHEAVAWFRAAYRFAPLEVGVRNGKRIRLLRSTRTLV